MGAKRVVSCRTCGAAITFVADDQGKKHPVDAEPAAGWAQVDGRWVFVRVYRDHFETCPEAERSGCRKEVG